MDASRLSRRFFLLCGLIVARQPFRCSRSRIQARPHHDGRLPRNETGNTTSTSRSARGRPTSATPASPDRLHHLGRVCGNDRRPEGLGWSRQPGGAPGRWPAGHIEGLSLRLYNPQSRQWSLNFSNSAGGTLSARDRRVQEWTRRVLRPGHTQWPRHPGSVCHHGRHSRFRPLRASILGRWRQDLGGELDRGGYPRGAVRSPLRIMRWARAAHPHYGEVLTVASAIPHRAPTSYKGWLSQIRCR